MKHKVHYSSQRMDWKTPKAVYQTLDAEFQFDHDPCPPSHKIDGLKSEWGGVLLCESSLRPRASKVDRERIYRVEERKDSGIPDSESHRHEVVARVLHEGYRDPIHKRSPEIRRSEKLCPIPVCNSNF